MRYRSAVSCKDWAPGELLLWEMGAYIGRDGVDDDLSL